MREPKPQWIVALRALTGNESDDIRFNAAVHRWEFVMAGADGIQRSQFWGQFYDPRTRAPIKPDATTGLHPFRELDDAAMTEALTNLEKTFVGNPHDGAGSTRSEVWRRIMANRAEGRKRYLKAGEAFADMAAERGHRLRGAAFSGSVGRVAERARRRIDLVIPNVIGGRK